MVVVVVVIVVVVVDLVVIIVVVSSLHLYSHHKSCRYPFFIVLSWYY